jgi:hypothetical protein
MEPPTRAFATDGSLTINAGAPSVGREAIPATARGFMTALPDLVVRMDRVRLAGSGAVYYWTLTGTTQVPVELAVPCGLVTTKNGRSGPTGWLLNP